MFYTVVVKTKSSPKTSVVVANADKSSCLSIQHISKHLTPPVSTIGAIICMMVEYHCTIKWTLNGVPCKFSIQRVSGIVRHVAQEPRIYKDLWAGALFTEKTKTQCIIPPMPLYGYTIQYSIIEEKTAALARSLSATI